jgi:transcriptional regulator with XRE-family HTH domain
MLRFGEKLRVLRQRYGMTQRDLADALGYASQGYITEIEAGHKQPTAEFVLKTADLFQVTTDQLMRDTLDLTSNQTRESPV